MPRPLRLDVFVVPYRPIVSAVPPMSAGEAYWPAISNSLISGEREAVLVDTPLVAEDAERVVDWIRETEKDLTTVYITHGHGDHFFGLRAILEAFPEARGVTAPEIVPRAQEQLAEPAMSFWNSILPNGIPPAPSVPDPLDGDTIDLEGHELRVILAGQADTSPTTMVHIPSLDAVIAGDIAYNGVHQYLSETDHDRRMQWITSIDQLRALEPKVVVAGHKDPGARDDDPARILDSTTRYLLDFERCFDQSTTPQELVDRMLELHGERTTPHSLWLSAISVFQQARS